MQQSSATPSLHHGFWGLWKTVACSQSSSQCLLVSIVFGTVFIFNDFYTCNYRAWVAEDCCMLLALTHSAFLCLQFLARFRPYILYAVEPLYEDTTEIRTPL